MVAHTAKLGRTAAILGRCPVVYHAATSALKILERRGAIVSIFTHSHTLARVLSYCKYLLSVAVVPAALSEEVVLFDTMREY